ncbi:MAG TPA: TonB-dependent receptor [Pyrinomonadaceae bacterium]|nr:TonB-dependent receptor [Pyrinomonadaceae bacterium]
MSSIVFGQADQGRITGTVTDANGALVPKATITVTNEKTGEVRTVESGDSGVYIIPALKASSYTIRVSAPNFSTNESKSVQLSVGQELTYDAALQVGATSTIVNITSSESAIDTASASISATVNHREVMDLPLNGRQLSQLYLQAPGTVNTGTGTFGDIRFSGRSNEQNIVRYDGVEGSAIIDASPGNLNGEVASPFRLQSSLENVQEFKADSNNYAADQGTGTGGQINVVTKSGGNQFHGSLFEYFRNEALDARNFFDNTSAGIPKSILRLNQFGGSFGGPIVKNKLFFFGSYEGYRVRAGVNTVELAPYLSLGASDSVLPTAANPQGLFALNPGGTPVNTNSRRFIPGFRASGAIPVGYSGVPGLEILQLQSTERTNEDAFFARVDYHFDDKNTFYVRYFQDKGDDIAPDGVSGRNTVLKAQPRNAVLGYTAVIGQNFVNEFKVGYNAAKTEINGSAPTVNGIDFSNLIVNVSGTVANLPSNTIAGQGASAGISVPGGLVRANSATNGRGQPYNPFSMAFIDNFNWTTGNHNAKFGGEVRFVRMKTDRLGGLTYTFQNFTGFLNGALQSTQFVGDLSSPSPFTGIGGQRQARQEYYIAYAQDEWKVRQGMTLSYGLRYEYYSPLDEKNDGQVFFDMTNGTLRDPSGTPFATSKSNFGPRVAFTWSPNVGGEGFFGGGKAVIRTGFGIYFGPGQVEDQIQNIESDRISSTVSGGTFTGNAAADITAITNTFLNNPNNRRFQPRAYSPNYKVPERVYQYTVSWQQQLPYDIVSTVAYVGSKGRNLFMRSVTNQILPGSAIVADTATAFPTGVGVINRVNGAGLVTGVTTVRQFDILNNAAACGASLTNPLCGPFAEVDYKTSGGRDSYNALQTSLSRRFDNGLTMNAQYTWASSRGTSSGSNDARTSGQLDNFEADFGRNNFDVRHTFNISALYELPFGKGKQYDLGGIGNALLGDWDIGGIVNARSGLPIEVLITRPDLVMQCTNPAAGCVAGQVLSLPGTINGANPLPAGFTAVINTPGGGASRNIRRPDVIAGVPFYLDNDRNILNPAAFTTPAPGTYGNLPRNALRGPNFRQFDMTFSKKIRLTENANIQFRTEIFNIFNTTNFANPAATLNNSISATFQPGQPFTQSLAGGTFGQIRSTVGRTVGLGTNRQIQFALRLNF